MNIISNIKNLSLISAIALGLALSPTLSLADNGNHARNTSKYKHDRVQSHNKAYNKDHSRSASANRHGNNHVAHTYGTQSRKYKPNNHHGRAHGRNMYHKHGNHSHNHAYTSHRHDHYVSHGHSHRGQYVDLDNLRFMVGLHTGNFDIIFRD